MFAAIYIPDFPVEAVMRAEPELRERAVAIVEGTPPLVHIVAVNEPAAQAGVERFRYRAARPDGTIELGELRAPTRDDALAALGKPIIVLKGGRTDPAASVVSALSTRTSITGALAARSAASA